MSTGTGMSARNMHTIGVVKSIMKSIHINEAYSSPVLKSLV